MYVNTFLVELYYTYVLFVDDAPKIYTVADVRRKNVNL